MTKPKQRRTARAPGKKHLRESSADPPDEGEWILVKKQKITILIPQLSDTVIHTAPSTGGSQPLEKSEPVSIHETQVSKSSSSCCKSSEDCSSLRSYREEEGRGNKGIMMYPDSSSTVFLDRRMRASFLEKKLKKAGGLENWLVSLGLGQFFRVFRTRRVTKFHLASLTMKKLKDMGTDAVGPRRKLMHAIDCLCEPHCFLRI